MPSSTINPSKKPRGRPPVDSEQINARLPRDILDALDAFISEQPDSPSRPGAVRRLLRDHLIGLGFLALGDN